MNNVTLYSCLTNINYFVAHGIWLPNFSYYFKIVSGKRRLSDSSEGLIMHFYLLEASFHLPLHRVQDCTTTVGESILVEFGGELLRL